MNYSINDFWVKKFSGIEPTKLNSVDGWYGKIASNPYFVEPGLSLSSEYSDTSSPIWLVAAAGAVGKSTLAKEIAAKTGAVYVNLAESGTVAAYALTGSIEESGCTSAWASGKIGVLIDALDEAKLKVTQKSYEDFLKDVFKRSKDRSIPTVLLGRVGIIDETWILLKDLGISCPIFNIDFFTRDQAVKFVMATVYRLANDVTPSGKHRFDGLLSALKSHREGYEKAAEKFVDTIGKATKADGDKFVGYAPVLEAVATVLAGENNPVLFQKKDLLIGGDILFSLTEMILDREQSKFRQALPPELSEYEAELYSPDEQVERLVAKVFAKSIPNFKTKLKPQHQAAYDRAVKDFISQHPFLDGAGQEPSGAVFTALINSKALFSNSSDIRTAGETYATRGPRTPNPFLVDFYLNEIEKGQVPARTEHVVALYESCKAKAGTGEKATLDVEGEADTAHVEIQVGKDLTKLKVPHDGNLLFLREVGGVFVDAPLMTVSIGSGDPVEVIAPVNISVKKIFFNYAELYIQKDDVNIDAEDDTVLLEAKEKAAIDVPKVPNVREGVELMVSWPSDIEYPWTEFRYKQNEKRENIDDSLRRLRQLVIVFRSHSKGQLARFKDKIEHARMTKGKIGDAIREQLLKDKILTRDGEMYFLDPNRLGSIVGARFRDLKMYRFNEKVRTYIAAIVKE